VSDLVVTGEGIDVDVSTWSHSVDETLWLFQHKRHPFGCFAHHHLDNRTQKRRSPQSTWSLFLLFN